MTELIVRGRWWLLALIALIALVAAPASAQSVSEQAQRWFDDGLKQLDAGNFAEACTSFERSQKLEPKVITLLNLAGCREKNHQLATAWNLFNDARQMADRVGDAELAGIAAGHVGKLDPRLSRLTIAVPPDRQVAGLVILRGKDPVPAASWNRPVPVDGGSYTITARAPGREPWSTTRAIKNEGDSQTVEIPTLGDAPSPVTPVAPTQPRPTGPPGEQVSVEGTVSDRGSLVLPIALGAGALALGGVGLGLEISSEHLYDRYKTAQMNGGTGSPEDLRSSANTRRHLGQGLGVAAGLCAGAAVYLFFVRSGERRTVTAIAPMVSPDLAGVAAVGRW
jgi:hypothetical protein